MSRKLPRAFFWVDQALIRNGVWLKLSAEARLAYIALSASCDREGVSIWSRSKLMELSACKDTDGWNAHLAELESHRLIEPVTDHTPPAIRVLALASESNSTDGLRFSPKPLSSSYAPRAAGAPIVVHTQTTIHLGGQSTHADTRDTN